MLCAAPQLAVHVAMDTTHQKRDLHEQYSITFCRVESPKPMALPYVVKKYRDWSRDRYAVMRHSEES